MQRGDRVGGHAASGVLNASSDLSRQSEALRHEVGSFIRSVREGQGVGEAGLVGQPILPDLRRPLSGAQTEAGQMARERAAVPSEVMATPQDSRCRICTGDLHRTHEGQPTAPNQLFIVPGHLVSPGGARLQWSTAIPALRFLLLRGMIDVHHQYDQ
jgi:hypothetical protein